ncbi:uncharacterized protein LOC143245362 isoform X11 [Tachypleus tridentatus]|uniref:uncharacterized protein LOC143245362 isoform X11 n=1 Tax=Tachypleus tridentatus TaxID=6853 RepID=UPI003FD47F38
MVAKMPVSGATKKDTEAGDFLILDKSNIPLPRRKEISRTANGVYNSPFLKQTHNVINRNRRKPENCDDLLGHSDWKTSVKSQDESLDQQFNKVLVVRDFNTFANSKRFKLLSSLAVNEFNTKSMCHDDRSFATNITRNDPENGTSKNEHWEDVHGMCENMQNYDGEEHTSVRGTHSTKTNVSQSNSLKIPLSKINISENILMSELTSSVSDKGPEVTEWTQSNSRVTENIHLADELNTYSCNKTTKTFSEGASSRKDIGKQDLCLKLQLQSANDNMEFQDDPIQIECQTNGSKVCRSLEQELFARINEVVDTTENVMEARDKNDEATVSKKLDREKMLRQDAELRLKQVQSESVQCRVHLVRLQRDLQRMEDIVRSLLHFKSQLDQLRHERTSITLKYEGKIRKYQAYIATLEKGNLLLVNEMQRKEEENNKEKSQEEKEISINRVLLKRIQLLEQENASLLLENEEQRLQYEHCLDDVANQVVQALLGQKNLREECGRLEERVHYLEQQNIALRRVLKQKQQPTETDLSHLCIPTSTSQGLDDHLLEPPLNELWTTCFLNNTSFSHEPMDSKHVEQNEFTSGSDNADDTEENEEIVNTVRWKNSKRKISKSQSDVQLAKHTNKSEFMVFSGYSDSGNLWKVPQQQRKAIQHSKEHSNAWSKPTVEKELLSVDNLSPLISSKKLSVPSHRTVQNVSAQLTQPTNQVDDLVIKSSQQRFNPKVLPYSTSPVYTYDNSSLSYLQVDNVAPEVENNLTFQRVPPCSKLDYDFEMFCSENQRNDPSKFMKHSICKKHNYIPWEISRESSALESVEVVKSEEQSTNQRTNTVVRKSHSTNDTGSHNVSQTISDTEFSGLLHSNENSSSSIEPDHISKDEGYSTMSSDIQVEIIENEKPNSQDHVQTWRRLEGSPSSSDSLSSVHSSTSEVTNSELFEDLNPTSLKCSRDNDLCSASEDECDIPEHQKFVQQWLQQEGEQVTKDCQRLYAADKKESREWTFQLYLENVKKATTEIKDNNIEAIIPSNNTSHLVLGSIKEEKEMEDDPFKTILEFCASDVSKLHLSKPGSSKAKDITGLTYSTDKYHHESSAGVSLRKIGNGTDTTSEHASSDCSREIDHKRATTVKRNWQTMKTSYSDKTGNGCLPEAPVSVSKNSNVITSERLVSEKRTSRSFKKTGYFSQINENPVPKTLQYRHLSSHRDIYNDSSLKCSNIYENREECDLEPNSKDCDEKNLAELNECSVPINSCFSHIESQNNSRYVSQNKECPTLSRPAIQSSKKHAKVKPEIIPKPCCLAPGNSQIPVSENQKNVECRQQTNNRSKIPVCIKPSATVSKKDSKCLGGHKQKSSPNRNAAYTKVKIAPQEKYRKMSKDSKNIAMKQEEKEISQNISPRIQKIKKSLIKKHKNQNYDRAPKRSTLESPETKNQSALPNHQSVSVELEQLSFESTALSVAQKIQILNNLLDESENNSISRLHKSDSVETCSVSPVIGIEADESEKEGCRSSWIHVSPEVDILSQLQQSSSGSSEESEDDVQKKESYHEEKLNNGCNSGIFSKSPEKQDLTKKCLKDRTRCRSSSKERKEEVFLQNIKSDSFSVVSNSPIHSKAIGITDSCMSVLSQEEHSSERVSFSDSCAESFCSSTRSLDL